MFNIKITFISNEQNRRVLYLEKIVWLVYGYLIQFSLVYKNILIYSY